MSNVLVPGSQTALARSGRAREPGDAGARVRMRNAHAGSSRSGRMRAGFSAPHASDRLAREMAADARDGVTIVTGVPRSGTSLVMQMLVAGGLPALSDGVRAPDADNPRGYFEYEPAKRLLRDAGWLPRAQGRALKVAHTL